MRFLPQEITQSWSRIPQTIHPHAPSLTGALQSARVFYDIRHSLSVTMLTKQCDSDHNLNGGELRNPKSVELRSRFRKKMNDMAKEA